MKRMSKKEWLKNAEIYFKNVTCKSIHSVISELIKVGSDEFGVIEYFAGNLRLFYTSNDNFAYGGIGWYLSNKGLSNGSTIKIKRGSK